MMTHTISSRSRLLGSILLVAGCCIGAGMLGLPVLTAPGGWLPSVAFLVVGWLFMSATGWVLLDVALNFPTDTSVIQMARARLGRTGAAIGAACWLFLLYALMVAYVLGTGPIVQTLLSGWINLPPVVGTLGFCGILAFALVHGARACDLFNRVLMIGLILGYVSLIYAGFPEVEPRYLSHVDWMAALPAFPLLVISFGFHNLVPTLVYYLERNRSQLRFAILVGAALPLVGYLVWEYVSMGLIPLPAFREGAAQGLSVTQIMAQVIGKPEILGAAHLFAFCAITTSFIATALSMMDFIKESLSLRSTMMHRWMICAMVLLPAIAIAWSYPDIFLKALTYAGAYGALVLFGVIPALMDLTFHMDARGQRRLHWLSWSVLVASIALIGLQVVLDIL